MKIKISLTDDKGETYVGEFPLTKIQPDKGDSNTFIQPNDDPMQILANECGVTIEKLKKIIEYDGVGFIFTGNLNEPDLNKKRAIISQYILTAWARGKKVEWVDALVLVESLRKLGINVKNMNRSIDSKDGIFRTDGQRAGLKYALTIPGWKKGLEMLKTEAEKM